MWLAGGPLERLVELCLKLYFLNNTLLLWIFRFVTSFCGVISNSILTVDQLRTVGCHTKGNGFCFSGYFGKKQREDFETGD